MVIMAALLQSLRRILFLIIFLTGVNCGSAESDDRKVVENKMDQDSLYFFYQQPEYPKNCKDVFNLCPPSNSSGVHLIKPTGYIDPSEVYCKNEHTSNGWTVIQRRLDGSVSFNRSWTEFKYGFGFLSSEFWLGNDILSYLTNQAVCELRIDMELSNGSSFYVIYNSFRISDEWSQYALVSIGSYESYQENAVTYCPLNMIYGSCTCQPTCSNPNDTTTCTNTCVETESCICENGFLKRGDECVPPEECECFVKETSNVIPNGDSYVNPNCSVKYTCQDQRLNLNSNYRCSLNAECRKQNGVRQCFCNEGYEGDGETCRIHTDCYDAYQAGHRKDGVYTILPSGWPGAPFNVSCVMSTNGGGWTVFQRRTDGATDFYQNWTSYRYGFGSIDGDFWLGNEQLHYLTHQKNYRLRIDIVTSGGSSKYDEYASFRINDNNNKFRLDNLGGRTGTAGHGMQFTQGRSFSTYDQDNDGCGKHNCARRHSGAWWYASNWCTYCYGRRCYNFPNGQCSRICTTSNLNGDYDGGNGENIFWDYYYYAHRYCNINFAEMKIRPS